jgi:hypothetical protein
MIKQPLTRDLISNPQALDEAWNEAVEQAGGVPIWAKLLRLYEGGAHIALGYALWADYCQIVRSPQVVSQVGA